MQNLAFEEAGVGNFSCEGSCGIHHALIRRSDILSLVKSVHTLDLTASLQHS